MRQGLRIYNSATIGDEGPPADPRGVEAENVDQRASSHLNIKREAWFAYAISQASGLRALGSTSTPRQLQSLPQNSEQVKLWQTPRGRSLPGEYSLDRTAAPR